MSAVSEAERRRQARMNKILQNSEKRMNRVFGVKDAEGEGNDEGEVQLQQDELHVRQLPVIDGAPRPRSYEQGLDQIIKC
jgi:hypothetical protein